MDEESIHIMNGSIRQSDMITCLISSAAREEEILETQIANRRDQLYRKAQRQFLV